MTTTTSPRAKTPSYRTITVTDADIEKAKRNDSYLCVVAQTIARTFPDAHRIDVDMQTIRFTERNERKAYLTPYAVQGYIAAFDAGERIAPFSFQLRYPMHVRRRLLTDAGRKIQKAASTSRRRAKAAGLPDAEVTLAARAAYAAAKAAHPGPKVATNDPTLREAPPRVFKLKARTYGHRMMRINRENRVQAAAAPAPAAKRTAATK
jgi:hypothetical protein